MQDIEFKLDTSQYGGRKGSGTEHLIVCYVDRVLKLLDSTTAQSAVIAAAADFVSAFDKTDPTLTASKFISIGIRPSIIPILISYMTNRKMIVKFKGILTQPYALIGGGPQGTLLGGLQYIITSNDCAIDKVKVEDRYKYYDDLNILEFVLLSDLLVNYNVSEQVPSDIGTHQKYLNSSLIEMQGHLDYITKWTSENLMQINESKSNFIIFTRSKQEFTTRLYINGVNLERLSVIKLLGIWLEEDMSWEKNTREICKKAFSRVPMLSKLKYAGIIRDDLLDIYKLFIQPMAEYCSVVFHTSLTQKQIKKIELIQSTCLKIILGSYFENYDSAMKLCSLSSLEERRSARMLNFALKCTQDKFNNAIFPLNINPNNRESFQVNFARTSKYFNSAVPQCQRMLNEFVNN